MRISGIIGSLKNTKEDNKEQVQIPQMSIKRSELKESAIRVYWFNIDRVWH